MNINFLYNLAGYGSFLFGMLIYLVGKAEDFKKLADANPNPNVKFSMADMFKKEGFTLVKMALGGLALVIFLPMLIGGSVVVFQNSHGDEIGRVAMKAAFIPLYFFVAMSGSSAVFAVLGKYRNDLMKGIGVEDVNQPKP